MKKIIALLLALVCCFSLCSCGANRSDESKEKAVKAIEKEDRTQKGKSDKEEKGSENKDTEDDEKIEDEKIEEQKKKEQKKKEKAKKVKTEQVVLYDSIAGIITENGDPDTYDLTLSESGKVTFNFKGKGIERAALKLYDEDGQEFWSDNPGWNSTSKQIAYVKDVYLTSGSYTLSISKYYGAGDYELTVKFKSAGESFKETYGGSNNDFDTPCEIEVDNVYWGQIAINDELDNYLFTLDEAGCLSVSYKAQDIERTQFKIYNEDGQEIWQESAGWNSTSKQISYKKDIELTAGTYFFGVSKYYGYGDYELGMDFLTANETFEEEQSGSDNTFDMANEIELGENYVGQIAINDNIDNYTFELDKSDSVGINLKAENIERIQIKIYDEDGQEVWDDTAGWNSTSKQISYEGSASLAEGTYYISFSVYHGYGDYRFSLTGK